MTDHNDTMATIDLGPMGKIEGEAPVMLDLMLSAAADDVVGQRLAETKAILPSIYTTQTPDLVVTELGQAALVFNKPLGHDIWWAEYDSDLKRLYFVTVGGQIMDLGMPIHPELDLYLSYTDLIYLVLTSETGRILNVDARKLVPRRTVFENKLEKAEG